MECFLCKLVKSLTDRCPNLDCKIYKVKNEFFGGYVTVAGLLTGTDIAKELDGKDLGETLYLPRTTLRAEGDLFLCGMTPDELSEKLGVKIEFITNDGAELCECLLEIC